MIGATKVKGEPCLLKGKPATVWARLMVLRETNYCHVLSLCCARSLKDEGVMLAFTPSAGVCMLLLSGHL